MDRNCINIAILAAVGFLSLPAPAPAQIASSVDSRGKLIFVNDDSFARGRGSTISSPPAAGSPKFGIFSGLSATPPDRLERIARHNRYTVTAVIEEWAAKTEQRITAG